MQTIRLKSGLYLLLASLAFLLACNREPIGPTEPDPVMPGTYMTIADFRKLHTGAGDVYVPVGNKKIRGVVISNSSNEAVGNFRVQDESGAGIYLYTVVGSPVYSQGTVLEIDAAGAGILTLFNGGCILHLYIQVRERLHMSGAVGSCSAMTGRNNYP